MFRSPSNASLNETNADIDSEKLNILAQEYLELHDGNLKTYWDVTKKADIWQAITIQILHAELSIWDIWASFVVHAVSFLNKDLQGTHQVQLSFHCPRWKQWRFGGNLTFKFATYN